MNKENPENDRILGLIKAFDCLSSLLRDRAGRKNVKYSPAYFDKRLPVVQLKITRDLDALSLR